MIFAEELDDENVDENDFNPAQADDVPTTTLAWEPSREELQSLHMLHNNMGHPTTATFCRLLRNAGCRRVVVQYVKTKFQCDVCAAHKQPALHVSAKSPKTNAFNAIVSLDLLFITNPITHLEEAFLNMVDWG
eukprot:3809156-Amphidinium_carterae.1